GRADRPDAGRRDHRRRGSRAARAAPPGGARAGGAADAGARGHDRTRPAPRARRGPHPGSRPVGRVRALRRRVYHTAAAAPAAALSGGLVPALRFSPAKTLRKALLGAGAAVAIAVGEEALFRGIVLRRIRRDAGDVLAVAATALVYAAVHVIRARSFAAPVHAWSGVQQTSVLFAPLASGAALPQVVGLSLLGVLLAVARLRSGALWLPIGIHAAFVAAFRVGRLFFEIRPTPGWLVGTGWPPLVGG